jgi:hypothetical protein
VKGRISTGGYQISDFFPLQSKRTELWNRLVAETGNKATNVRGILKYFLDLICLHVCVISTCHQLSVLCEF